MWVAAAHDAPNRRCSSRLAPIAIDLYPGATRRLAAAPPIGVDLPVTAAASAPPGPPAPAPRAETSRSLASTVRLPAPDAADALSSIEAIVASFDDERVSTFATIGLPPPAEDRRRVHLPRFSTRPPSATGSGSVEFGDVLGRGGMGVVLTATQRSLDREIAVKRVHEDADHHEAGNRLVVEALLTGALQHPNIVPVYELGTDEDGAPLMLMKRIEGRPWQKDLQHAPKPGSAGWSDWIEAQLRVLIAVCDALRYAHARGILHRDLKPENVMLGAFGEVLVVDWGVAVSTRPEHAGRFPLAVESRHIAGTPAYMAPEQVRGVGSELGVWTDVYLLGAILHELLTGRAPHDAERVHASLFSAFRSEPPTLPPQVPETLAEICRCALARDPSDRFADVEALRTAITAYLRNRASIEITDRSLRLAVELFATAPAEASVDGGTFDPQGVHRKFAACRFGFQQALEIWPENPRARAGLQRVLALMIERSLDAGEIHQAALLAQELPDRDPALDERLQQARKARAERDRDLHALGAIGYRHDYRIGQANRRRFSIGLASVNAVVCVGEAIAQQKGYLDPVTHAMVPFVQLLITFVYGLVRWEAMRAAGVNQRLFHVATITLGAVVLERALGWMVNAPIGVSMAFELLLFFIGIGATAALTRRSMAPSMLPYALGSALSATLQGHALWISAGAHLLGIGLVAVALRSADDRPVDQSAA